MSAVLSIPEDWRRICGVHFEADGTSGAAWIAYDRQTDTIHLYDCCIFRRTVPVLIAESLNNHGRWIPIAWEKKQKPMADKLKERGCNMTVDPHEDDDAVAEAVSADIDERILSGRLRRDFRTAEWQDEYKEFRRHQEKVPRNGRPLMTATRYAVGMFDEWARPERVPGAGRKNYPSVAIV